MTTYEVRREVDETQSHEAIQEVVSGLWIEVRPDLGPGLAHEPLAYGDVKAGHEDGQSEPKN